MATDACLITGGAGFLGINLVRLLLSRHVRIRTLDLAPFEYPEQTRIEAILGDIRDPGCVERAMRDIDIVIHCAAALPLADETEIVSTDVDGTRVLLEAAWRHGVSRFIFISSTAVYGLADHHPIHEDDPLQGVGPCGRAKLAAERLCLDYRAGCLCVPILRPKSFVGPERLGAFEWLYDWAFDGHNFPVPGRGDNAYQLLDVADLCEVIHLCMTLDPCLVNDTFNVGAQTFGSMRDNVQAVLDRAGHGKRVVAVPAWPAVRLLRLLETLRLSPLYRWSYETATRDSVVSIEHLQTGLGFTPRYSNRAALLRNYDWYAAHRTEIGSHRGSMSYRAPWHRGALRLAKSLF